jgi:hypothetical protein
MEAFASFLVMLMVTYLSLSVLFSFSIFELIDSLQIDTETVHVGAVGNLDGGNFLAFCSEREGKGTCEYFFTQYWLDGSPKLNLETDSKNVLVSLQDTIIYQYDGRFPGRCIVTAEKLVSGNCGSYFHGGNSGR